MEGLFELRKKIFYIVSLLGILVFTVSFFVNLFVGSNIFIIVSSLFFALLFLFTYWFSKDKERFERAIDILLFPLIFGAFIFWYFDGGIRGSVGFYLISYTIAVGILAQGKKRNLLFALVGFIFLSFFLVEILRPGLLFVEVPSSVYILNMFTGISTVLAITMIGLIVVVEGYKREREIREEYSEKLKNLSIKDPLTGLFNRREIIKNIDYERKLTKRGGPLFSLVMCDIDNFKALNDRYGHNFGDTVLKGIAALLSRQVREYDTVSRWGGEEFLILFPKTGRFEVKTIIERIKKMLEEKVFLYKTEKVYVTATFGIMEATSSEYSVLECIDKADKAMYDGKMHGKNCIVVYKESYA